MNVASKAPAAAAPTQGPDRTGAAWARFARAASAHGFCQGWLDVQCLLLGEARAGLLILEADGASFAPAAIWPDPAHDVTRLAAAAETALRSRRGEILPGATAAGPASATTLIAHPIDIRGHLFGAVVVELPAGTRAAAEAALQRLQWGAGWLEVLFRRRQADGDARALARAELALDLTVAAMEEATPRAAAMALSNALVSRLGARSATAGLLEGRRLRIQAMSRTAWFRKRSHLATALTNAMEEVMDQSAPVAWPERAATEGRIAVAHRDLAALAKADALIGVPLLAAGRPVGALLLDFTDDAPPTDETVLMAEAVGAVAGSALDDKRRAHRFVGGRTTRLAGALWRELTDPRRVTAKLAILLAAGGLYWLATATTTLRVTADAVVEGAVQRAIVAPIDGFVEEAPLRAGDLVEAGALLARLDDRDLALEALRLQSAVAQARTEYRNALAIADRREAGLLQARIEEAEAELRLIEAQRARLEIRAPISGVVVSGDLTQQLGTPVTKGDPLFEIAPLDDYRVVLEVDERDILMLAPGQPGTLALAAVSERRLPITVSTVQPVSTPADGRNFFRVEAALADPDIVLRPGMEGVGKVGIREAPLVWVWVRPVWNWLRLAAWRVTP